MNAKPKMVLYHVTNENAAQAILKEGFRDAKGKFLTDGDQEFEGVWLSDRPVGIQEGTKTEEATLKVTLTLGKRTLAKYEWVEEGKHYREWLIPAGLLNRRSTIERIRR